MPPVVALGVCVVLVAVLLWIEGKRNDTPSIALWVPTIWMLISGSRPVGRWFAVDPVATLDNEAGSLPDRLVLVGLTILAVVILSRRKIDWSRLLKDNAWLFLFFVYMGLSILWAEYPFVSTKRWIRSTGPLVMAVVIASELKPRIALESILRRCAYVLVPFSVLLIKYYPMIGRAYGRWDGLEMWTGTTTHKNSLGQFCAVSAFFLIWSLMRKERSRDHVPTRLDTLADLAVLGMTAYLLYGPGTYSATSISITAVGLAIFLMLRTREKLAAFVTDNLKKLVVASVLLYAFFAEPVTVTVSSMLGRGTNLTGRATDIWPVVLEVASHHPILGVGYGGAWGPGTYLSTAVGVDQAHNGYLDVYLQLGIIGVILLAAFLLSFCTAIRRIFQHEYDWGVFGTAFLLMLVLYNLSETAFFDVYLGTTMALLPIVLAAPWNKAVVRAVRLPRNEWSRATRLTRTSPIPSGRSVVGAISETSGTDIRATRHRWPRRGPAGKESGNGSGRTFRCRRRRGRL